jgi:tetratricopeptide (TPR) repeat protein
VEKRTDLRHFLGLEENTSPDEVGKRCEALLDWLNSESVPQELRAWASAQRELVQDFYEGLTLDEELIGDESGVEDAVLTVEESRRGGWGVAGLFAWLRNNPIAFGLLGIAIGAALMSGIFWGVVSDGSVEDVNDSTTQEATDMQQYLASQQQRITELEQLIAADPHDVASIEELGEIYMIGQDWQQALQWFNQLLAIDPDNIHALTDIGTAGMNLGLYDMAEATFSRVLEIDPDNAQVHYNTGFLFAFRTDAPDLIKAVEHWEEVVRLDPDSTLAEIAQVHLDQFQPESSSP